MMRRTSHWAKHRTASLFFRLMNCFSAKSQSYYTVGSAVLATAGCVSGPRYFYSRLVVVTAVPVPRPPRNNLPNSHATLTLTLTLTITLRPPQQPSRRLHFHFFPPHPSSLVPNICSPARLRWQSLFSSLKDRSAPSSRV